VLDLDYNARSDTVFAVATHLLLREYRSDLVLQRDHYDQLKRLDPYVAADSWHHLYACASSASSGLLVIGDVYGNASVIPIHATVESAQSASFFEGPGQTMWSIDLDSSGRTFVAGYVGEIRVSQITLRNGRYHLSTKIAKGLNTDGPIREVAWISETEYIALADDGVLRRFQLTSGAWRQRKEIRADCDSFGGFALSPDKQRLAVSIQNRPRVITVESGEVVTGLAESGLADSPEECSSISWSPCGIYVAFGFSDGKVKVWDMRYPQDEPFTMNAHSARGVRALCFTNDGVLYSGGDDNRIVKTIVAVDKLADSVCNLVRRNLTRQEWFDFVGTAESYQLTCPNYTSSHK
jgi:WD40 repeat protein